MFLRGKTEGCCRRTNTTRTQAFAALCKTNNFDDALYTAGIGVAAAISTHTQLTLEVLNVYKDVPPLPTIKRTTSRS